MQAAATSGSPGRVPLAWRQLVRDPLRLAAAVAGVAFATLLMLMQLGFRAAMLESAVRYQERLDYDLVMLSRQTVFMGITHPFPRQRLYQAAGLAAVEWVAPLYGYQQHFENPWEHNTRNIMVVGIDPRRPVLLTPGVAEALPLLHRPDAALFDRLSRVEFGPVAERFARGEPVTAEIAGKRVEVVGLFELGSSFGLDGNVLVSEEGFLRLFPHRSQGAIDLGLLKLRPGTDAEEVRAALAGTLERDVEVLTREGFVRRELAYWQGTTPIGYVFGFGLVMGFVVGAIIVYQILFTDVADNRRQYATLKAIGWRDGALAGVVVRQAVMLALLGFVPGVLLSLVAFRVAGLALGMPVRVTAGPLAVVFVATVLMCAVAGLGALRKLREADPAELF
jgi:putative ABC transport system permease protein